MPSENNPFTTHVDPVSPPSETHPINRVKKHAADAFVVEAPGTAPGSDTLIPNRVYRHSRLPDTSNIAIVGKGLKTLLESHLPIFCSEIALRHNS